MASDEAGEEHRLGRASCKPAAPQTANLRGVASQSHGGLAPSADSALGIEVGRREYPAGPGPARAVAVVGALALLIGWLTSRVETGVDALMGKVGRIEVAARLLETPEHFPQLGAYRYTYTLKYAVLKVFRQDPAGKYKLAPGEVIFVGHYKPWLPRDRIKDADWGEGPLGGKLTRFVAGEVHRLALDYELQDLAPSGVLDYCFPPGTNRFFAVWANPTTY